jgi:hypothetical protein
MNSLRGLVVFGIIAVMMVVMSFFRWNAFDTRYTSMRRRSAAEERELESAEMGN